MATAIFEEEAICRRQVHSDRFYFERWKTVFEMINGKEGTKYEES